MSFVSKGEKKMRNMAKKAGAGADGAPAKDGFGKKGDGHRSGAAHNTAPGSKDKTAHPVSEDATSGEYDSGETASKSEYDPASGKRAKSVADLRSAVKKINERSDAGESSPTGKQGGQDAKHTSSSKNESGFMKGAGMSDMDKKSKKAPIGEADQEAGADEMEDPMDEDEEDNGQTEMGMTPKGKSRAKMTSLKMLKKKIQSFNS